MYVLICVFVHGVSSGEIMLIFCEKVKLQTWHLVSLKKVGVHADYATLREIDVLKMQKYYGYEKLN